MVQEHRAIPWGKRKLVLSSLSPLRLLVDLPLSVAPVSQREGAVRFQRFVVGTTMTEAVTGTIGGESTCMGFWLSSDNWSSVRCNEEARD
jgi:hypothetical protein